MLPVRFMNTDLCQFFSFFQNFLCLIPCLPIYDCFMVIPQIIGFHLLIRIGLLGQVVQRSFLLQPLVTHIGFI